MDRIADLVDADIAALRAHRAAMDTRAIEAERSFAAKRALFDPSPEATLARKAEAAAERGIYRALEELRKVEAQARANTPSATAEIPAEPEPQPEQQDAPAVAPSEPSPLGSFLRPSSEQTPEGLGSEPVGFAGPPGPKN